jgi:transcription antitermination protein NusB
LSTNNKDSAKPTQVRSARRQSRQVALQGLYQWLLSGEEAGVIDAHLREQGAYAKCDQKHLDLLLHGCIREAAALDGLLAAHVDRPTKELSPIEHGALMIGAFELQSCIDIPYRVVINEAVELAKGFGGTDGHKYVNGVLDRLAAQLRRTELEADRKPR